jgi:hypothetical protein
VGAAYQKFVVGATTRRELLPHRAFWVHVGGLVMDGVAFSRAVVQRRE